MLYFVNSHGISSVFTTLRRRVPVCPSCQNSNWRIKTIVQAKSSQPSTQDAPQREIDPRGFVVPRPGDIVLYPGRWRDEEKVGLVDGVRYVEYRSSYNVDVLEMNDIGGGLYAVQGGLRGKSKRWFDVGDVRVAAGATYNSQLDAYRVENVKTGYKEVVEDEEARERALAEYEELKQKMLAEAAFAACGGAALAYLFLGSQISSAFGIGGVAGFGYLLILQRSVDNLGKVPSAFFLFRYAMPALPFLLLSLKTARIYHGFHGPINILNAIPRQEAVAAILGFLTYKVPVLRRTGSEVLKSLATVERGGTMGMAANIAVTAARTFSPSGSSPDHLTSPQKKTILVFAGPSGVGKSTLINRLMDSYPSGLAFSVSHTTRDPREGEVDGVDYNFISKEEFESKIASDDFIEYAQVHEYYYGTSYQAVEDIAAQGSLCVLDVDVQGVESLRRRALSLNWDLKFIWVAPPSLDALRERLMQRHSETESSLKLRLEDAQKEMEYAATHNVFDLTLINDNIDSAYRELKVFVSKAGGFSTAASD